MIQSAQFNTAASSYTQFATIQNQIGQTLLKHIHPSHKIKGSALDFGCGSGALTSQLTQYAHTVIGYDPAPAMIEHARQSHAQTHCTLDWTSNRSAIQDNGPFSLVFSNAALQWVNNLNKTIAFLAKNCQTQLLFSVFGPKTFQELASIWPKPIIASQFQPLSHYERLVSRYFPHVSASYHRIVYDYASLTELLQTIKGTGAYVPSSSGLLTPRQLQHLESNYLNQYGVIKATYDYVIVDGRY